MITNFVKQFNYGAAIPCRKSYEKELLLFRAGV
jgi:hypothetical protein